ncbi:MAG: A/G-specific adenine glycosylase [Candidatus Sumerlaeaceae bacterium]|nr:A/G-specific adenine glycosylase [Candidatus Sumerlaeaceae bacterium]
MTEFGPDSTPDFPAAAFSRRLVRWYRRQKRALPWRETSDPYAILVSEVMLQQTTVATVLGYYARFLSRFPTVRDLAEAPEDELLAVWSGLGYYRRARNLQAAARVIMAQHAGRVPQTLEALMALPGIGRYTAGAIMSFAFNKPSPIVETNSARVLARLFCVRAPVKSPATVRQLWHIAEQILPPNNPREHNYALMELGSLACRPSQPDCVLCPVSEFCAAFKAGEQRLIPPADAPAARTRLRFVGVVPLNDGHVLVARIPQGEWHAGMFEFPKVPVPLTVSDVEARETAQQLLQSLGLRGNLVAFREFRYTVTRHSITLCAWMAMCRRPARPPGKALRWVPLDEAGKLPLGSAQRRVLAWVSNDQRPGGT